MRKKHLRLRRRVKTHGETVIDCARNHCRLPGGGRIFNSTAHKLARFCLFLFCSFIFSSPPPLVDTHLRRLTERCWRWTDGGRGCGAAGGRVGGVSSEWQQSRWRSGIKPGERRGTSFTGIHDALMLRHMLASLLATLRLISSLTQHLAATMDGQQKDRRQTHLWILTLLILV